jgi:hypothetical protein
LCISAREQYNDGGSEHAAADENIAKHAAAAVVALATHQDYGTTERDHGGYSYRISIGSPRGRESA